MVQEPGNLLRVIRQLQHENLRTFGCHRSAFNRVIIDENETIQTEIEFLSERPQVFGFREPVQTPGGELLQTQRHIEALPEHYRAVFVMREVEGMSTAESAECLDITEETAKTRLHRARMLLRETLYERAGIENAAAFSFEAPRCDRVVAGVLAHIEAIHESSLPRPE